jgi:hypothetical protein
LLKCALTIDLLSDAVEQLRELDKVPFALDEPLLILETTLLQLANKLDAGSKYRRAFNWPERDLKFPDLYRETVNDTIKCGMLT